MLQRVSNRLPAIAGGLGAASLVVGLGAYLVTGQFDRQVLILLAIGVALLLIAASYYPQELLAMLRGRSVRYGSNTFATIVIFLAILSLINFYSINHSYRWDLTASKKFTLSQQTLNILNKLQAPMKLTAFYASGTSADYEDLLKQYKSASDKIDYQFIDPDRMPAVARQYKIQQYGTTVIEYHGKRQDVTGFGEQDLTSAILKLTSEKTKKIYFLAGHGELNVDSFDGPGGAQIKQALQAENYDVTVLNLAAKGSVPDDADVLVVAGAKNQFLDDEKKALKEYLDKGGKALIMVDPHGSPSVTEVLKDWGIEVGNGVAVDPASSIANQPQVPVVMQYNFNQITKDMTQQMTMFPLATSITVQKDLPKGETTAPLFQTTDKAWLETDQKVIKFDEGKDVRGPLTLAMTVQMGETSPKQNPQGAAKDEAQKPKTRMVVIGNSAFASNDLAKEPALANKHLFTNAVNWLAEDEDLISIGPKEPAMNQTFLTGAQESFVFYSSAVFLPLLVIIAGVAVWWNRR